ncbi:High-affinity Fe2+/Pb2+ permease-like protein [Thermobaculum terrenum ATCC BAA-798]|uniref:High-affinity Fe2+/Pb2+ permease-like protein n=1 Tax=Thermobaculum terrenum (strain ATCC BAA-798 / CCMEE 7001 / YNP1) TaxID=525904 RepID=D1CHK8_THET1|nr:iron permease [Thermobaculum terrenum]ACZ43229.1 High-affinity Fe2+/Pb2+ permease-like protein [Thermobaculum terrenum ATCC BAA-798]
MSRSLLRSVLVCAGGALLLGVLIWQAVRVGGAPDPTARGISPMTAMMDTAVLVYREGLECILVLSAIVAGLVRTKRTYWRPIASGAGLAIGATLITWFVLVGILNLISGTTSELNIQAATGLLAIVVLLIIMNWFFHKIYWTGWISLHNRRKKELINTMESSRADSARSLAYRGLILLGFTSVYREGFEVDLFLQNIRLQVGSTRVVLAAAIALVLVAVTGYFTFVAHQRLPYKKMLVFTGIMLGAVLEIMVGEQVNEMQLAGWLPVHTFPLHIPDWMGIWFSLFNNWETVIAQVLAAVLVIGSFYAARRDTRKPRAASPAVSAY